jgi:hypothetical protein
MCGLTHILKLSGAQLDRPTLWKRPEYADELRVLLPPFVEKKIRNNLSAGFSTGLA